MELIIQESPWPIKGKESNEQCIMEIKIQWNAYLLNESESESGHIYWTLKVRWMWATYGLKIIWLSLKNNRLKFKTLRKLPNIFHV